MSRTLVVTNDFPPRVGGIESFALEMARRLPADEVVVHTARQPGQSGADGARFDAELAFPVVRDPARLLVPTPRIAARVTETARRFGCDSVWFAAAAPLGLLAATLRRDAGVRRTVASTHGHEVWWARTPGARSALRRIGETNDVLTYISGFTRDGVGAGLTPRAREALVPLPPGVDADVFHPGVDGSPVRQRYGLGDRPVVVCVSRLVARKGQDTLIRALPSIRAQVPDVALLIVGDGPAAPGLRRLAADLAVQDDVVFAGRQNWADTPPYVAAGDVFAMPARTRRAGLEIEGLGIVYLEASACGRPVVAGDSGGAPDAVQDGMTGYVVDGRAPEHVAARIITLLTDRPLAREMGARGRAWIEQSWRWDERAARLAELLAG